MWYTHIHQLLYIGDTYAYNNLTRKRYIYNLSSVNMACSYILYSLQNNCITIVHSIYMSYTTCYTHVYHCYLHYTNE